MENSLIQNTKDFNKLPKEWKVFHFDEVMDDVSGGNLKTLKSDFLEVGEIAVIDQGKELIAGYTNENSAIVKTKSPHIIFGDHTRILKYIDFPFAMGADGTKVLKIKSGIEAIEKYAYYFFRTLNIPETGYNRHYKYLKDCLIPLPPLPTQQRIASILDQANAIVTNNRAIVAKYDALTQSLFLDMFGDPVKNEKGWDIVKLSKLSEITSSRRIFKDEYVENGIPFYRTKEIVELSKNKKISSELYISFERYTEIKKKNDIPQIGDILLSAVGTIGVMWIVNNNESFYFKDGNLIWLKMSKAKNINSKYLIMTLEYLIEYEKGNLAQGAAYNALTIDKLKQFNVNIAPIQLQTQFAERVQAIETQKQQAQLELAKSEALFQSLLQGAFKGELS